MSESEVARLRRQIELEFEAMQRGLCGLTAGGVRHEFIRIRMKQVGSYQEQLAEHIGDSEAIQVVCSLYAYIVEK